jgi:hypothetical protein
LGFPTTVRVNPVTDTVGTTATLILRNNPERIFWLAVNLSVNKGYVGWDAQVSSSKGIPIAPSGGYVSCTLEEDGELTIHEVYAVLENASGTFYVLEITAR